MKSRRAAFTMIELLVIVGIVAILIGMFPASLTTGRAKSKRIQCVSNLKNMGLGFRIFATDNGDLFPWETFTNKGGVRFPFATNDLLRGFLIVSNEMNVPHLYKCPADTRKRADTWSTLTLNNISYFIGVHASETYPQSLLSGDRNITTNGVRLPTGAIELPMNANAGWDNTQHQNQGNAVMGDGSVQQLSNARLREQFKNTGRTNITLAIP